MVQVHPGVLPLNIDFYIKLIYAPVAELADALDLKSSSYLEYEFESHLAHSSI